MKITFAVLITIIAFTCKAQTGGATANSGIVKEAGAPEVALKFMNDYVELCTTRNPNEKDWVKQNKLLTDSFKASYKKLISDAEKKDPEYGLGFDPIFDTQDFPTGFEFSNYEKGTGYVTVKGKDWADFILVLKVVRQHNEWLVDGAGVINIPKEKRAKR